MGVYLLTMGVTCLSLVSLLFLFVLLLLSLFFMDKLKKMYIGKLSNKKAAQLLIKKKKKRKGALEAWLKW